MSKKELSEIIFYKLLYNYIYYFVTWQINHKI